MTIRDTIADCETFPNFFCCCVKHVDVAEMGTYEISERRNDAEALAWFMLNRVQRMAGFNNESFDYPLIHYVIQAARSGEAAMVGGYELCRRLYTLAQKLIEATEEEKFSMRIWDKDKYVPQLDLRLVWNMDNPSRMTSLKALQFAMRSPFLQDLPFEPGTVLTHAQMDQTIDYCCHDVGETGRFYELSRDEIAFRAELGPDFTNLGETRLGKKILRDELERVSPGCTRRQTIRSEVPLREIILPYVSFQHDEFQRLHRHMWDSVVPADKAKKFVMPTIFYRNFHFKSGTGGLHASIRRTIVRETEEHEVLDVDVTSFYPRLAIVNGMRPAHLGDAFNAVYNDIFETRQTFPKGTPKNTAFKFALNAIFGDSGNRHSKFRDVAFMLGITINGQLLLCMLAEAFLDVPGLQVIQANTDGLTVRYPRRERPRVGEIIAWWQHGTALKLEHKFYRFMHIRDVNSYLAQDVDGKVKRVGAFEYKLDWWQDHSAIAVARATEAAILHRRDPAEFLRDHLQVDPWDFLIRERAKNRKDRLTWGGMPLQRTSRFYVATDGAPIHKIMPPLPGKTENRISVRAEGRPVRIVNVFDGRPPADLDFSYYVGEVHKLMNVGELK